jgi:hypothetical protein
MPPPSGCGCSKRPGGETLILTVHNAATESIGMIRLMHSIVSAYACRSDRFSVPTGSRPAGASRRRALVAATSIVPENAAGARGHGMVSDRLLLEESSALVCEVKRRYSRCPAPDDRAGTHRGLPSPRAVGLTGDSIQRTGAASGLSCRTVAVTTRGSPPGRAGGLPGRPRS